MSEKRIGFFIREKPYGFLSNFDRTPFEVDGIIYATNEHYYQSEKVSDSFIGNYIALAPHARIAMVLGREFQRNKYLKKYMKPNWDMIKQEVMMKGLRAKFSNPELREKLLATGDAILFEDNPEDPYWGIGDGTGASWLGRCLMQVRDELKRQREGKS